MCFAPQQRALFRHLNFQKWREHVVICTFWLGNVLRATTACTFSTSELPKVVWTWCALYILTWKCASRHNGVHFFDMWTAKSGPNLVCFVHFDLEMCFAPQRRALFRHRNFQKWSGPGVFCTFWLGNVLRATTACTFSTSQLPKVVRQWCVLYILASKCASRHNGVQLFISHLASWLRTRRFCEPTFRPPGAFISHLASWLRTRRFCEPTFRPPGAPNHWKNIVFRDFPTFSRISIFFLLTLSLLLFFLLIFLFSLPLPCSAFHLSILLEVWLLNFLRQGICPPSFKSFQARPSLGNDLFEGAFACVFDMRPCSFDPMPKSFLPFFGVKELLARCGGAGGQRVTRRPLSNHYPMNEYIYLRPRGWRLEDSEVKDLEPQKTSRCLIALSQAYVICRCGGFTGLTSSWLRMESDSEDAWFRSAGAAARRQLPLKASHFLSGMVQQRALDAFLAPQASSDHIAIRSRACNPWNFLSVFRKRKAQRVDA